MDKKNRSNSKPLSYYLGKKRIDPHRLEEIRSKLEDLYELQENADHLDAYLAAQDIGPEDVQYLLDSLTELDKKKNQAANHLEKRLRFHLKILDKVVKRRLQQARSDYDEKKIYKDALEFIAQSDGVGTPAMAKSALHAGRWHRAPLPESADQSN